MQSTTRIRAASGGRRTSASFLAAPIVLLAFLASPPTAQATSGFTGPFAFGNWTNEIINCPLGCLGSTAFVPPDWVRLRVQAGTNTLTIEATEALSVSFDWALASCGECDLFSWKAHWMLNGSATQISISSQTLTSDSGSETFAVQAGDVFGFRFQNNSSVPAGALTITGFNAVPEPGTASLLAGGLALLAWKRRRLASTGTADR